MNFSSSNLLWIRVALWSGTQKAWLSTEEGSIYTIKGTVYGLSYKQLVQLNKLERRPYQPLEALLFAIMNGFLKTINRFKLILKV